MAKPHDVVDRRPEPQSRDKRRRQQSAWFGGSVSRRHAPANAGPRGDHAVFAAAGVGTGYGARRIRRQPASPAVDVDGGHAAADQHAEHFAASRWLAPGARTGRSYRRHRTIHISSHRRLP